MISRKRGRSYFPSMRITIFFLSLIFFSCNQPGNPIKVQHPSATQTGDTLRIIKEFKGIYSNPGTKQFIDCDHPGMIYSITDENSALDAELKKIQPNAYPGQGIFVNMKAEVNASDNKEFAGSLVIKELLKAEQKNMGNNCIPYEFWCMGNEPFWQVQISKTENLIDYYDPMEQKTIHFGYSAPEQKEEAFIYTAVSADKKSKIMITVLEEKCTDGMSEKKYDHSATVILDGMNLKGCAVKYQK
jgi:uncharacterized membrane protein